MKAVTSELQRVKVQLLLDRGAAIDAGSASALRLLIDGRGRPDTRPIHDAVPRRRSSTRFTV